MEIKRTRKEGRIGIEKESVSKGESRKRKVLFWNVAGIGRQDVEFRDYIGNYDFISLNET